MKVKRQRILAVVLGGGIGLGVLTLQISQLDSSDRSSVASAAAVALPGVFTVDTAPIQPLPPADAADPAAALGATLFHDPRLSADGSLSCASCHDVAAGGDDGQPRSRAILGTQPVFHTPSVINSRFNLLHYWRGEAQGFGSASASLLHGAAEMGSSPALMSLRVEQDAGLSRRFAAVYRQGVTEDTVRRALEAYLHALSSPNARFDRYLRGEHGALTYRERRGYRLFRELGCAACHQGRNIGGNMTQRMGIFEPYFGEGDDEGYEPADLGRFGLTGLEQDRGVFRVPSLRNVAETAPYFHDGSVKRLDDAVRIMAWVQLGRRLTHGQTEELVAFLRTLSADPTEVPR